MKDIFAEFAQLLRKRLADARDYLLELLDAGDFDSWDTERAADVLGLSGYARVRGPCFKLPTPSAGFTARSN